MSFIRRAFLTVIFSLLCTLSISTVNAASITVSDMGVDNAEGNISVGFSIVVQDVEPLLQALQSGGEFEVVCLGRLYQHRIGLWDSLLGENTYTCRLSSRTIARECSVRDASGEYVVAFKELQQDLNRIWKRVSLPMGSWELVERNNVYRVVLEFQIVRKDSAEWLPRPLFFVNADLIPKMVYEFDFDY